MYKRLALALFMVLSLIVSPLMSSVAQALSPVPYANSLVKLDESSSVYWVADNGKRYVFPTGRTFTTWFSESDFSRVITISSYQMANITLGGNVTYRPGVRLVKITTDPKVYAVSRYGTLRWITSEALAVQLYGYNWAQQVDDVPDEYFFNYRIGDAIYNSSQFNVAYETGLARSPSDNIVASGTTPPGNTGTNGYVTLSVSNSNPLVNSSEATIFTASAVNSPFNAQYASLSIVRADTSEVYRTCQGLNCSYSLTGIATSFAGQTLNFFARVTNTLTGGTYESGRVSIYPRNATYNNQGGFPTVSISNAHPNIGDTYTITASSNNLDPRLGTLNIFGPFGTILNTCAVGSTTCSFSILMNETNATNIRANGGSYGYTARFIPTSGVASNSASTYVYAPGSGSSTNNQATAHTLTFSQSTVRPGENFTVTSRLTPDSTSAPYYTIRIYDQWNVLQHTCYNVRTCVLQQTLSATADTSRTYYASATADNSHSIGSGNATVNVTPSISSDTNGRLGLSQTGLAFVPSPGYITSSPFTVYSGTTLTISSDLQAPIPTNLSGITIKLYQQDGILLKTCNNVNRCAVDQVLTNTSSSTDVTYNFKARVEDAYGSFYDTGYSPVIVRATAVAASPFSATLVASANPLSVFSNNDITLKATVSDANIDTGKIGINWYDQDGSLVKSCMGSATCDTTASYATTDGDRTVTFHFIAWDASGVDTGTLTSNSVDVLVRK